MKAQIIFMIVIFLIAIIAIVGFVYYLDKETKPLIEKCSEVGLDRLQECCDNWAKENGVFVITCIGEWEIKDNACAWKCDAG